MMVMVRGGAVGEMVVVMMTMLMAGRTRMMLMTLLRWMAVITTMSRMIGHSIATILPVSTQPPLLQHQ